MLKLILYEIVQYTQNIQYNILTLIFLPGTSSSLFVRSTCRLLIVFFCDLISYSVVGKSVK